MYVHDIYVGVHVGARGQCCGISCLSLCRYWELGSKSGSRFGSKLLYLLSHLIYQKESILKVGFHLKHSGEPGKVLS